MKMFVLVAGIFVHGNPEPVHVDQLYSFSAQHRCEYYAEEYNRRARINFAGSHMMMAFICQEQDGRALEESV